MNDEESEEAHVPSHELTWPEYKSSLHENVTVPHNPMPKVQKPAREKFEMKHMCPTISPCIAPH